MLYYTLHIGDKEYKCRLTARACVELEKKLGENPLNVFIRVASSEGNLPELGSLITILHASLQSMEHNISLEKTYDIYDEFVDEGHTMMDLVPVILEIFKVSGFFNEEQVKNAQAVE
jgi:hypothetical protein